MDTKETFALFALLALGLVVIPVIIIYISRKYRIVPIESVDLALNIIDKYDGPLENFHLVISDSLQDPQGINMAIITDRTAKKGWMPASFIQLKGCRVYSYITFEEFEKRNANNLASPDPEPQSGSVR